MTCHLGYMIFVSCNNCFLVSVLYFDLYSVSEHFHINQNGKPDSFGDRIAPIMHSFAAI